MTYSVTYEEGFLVREIGSIGTKPDVAITELIANAHDAGASKVSIIIPADYDQYITVEDNGIGLSNREFEQRWLKLRYDRRRHQGSFVEIPEDNDIVRRRLAFGRNGVGRHAGLCFDDSYIVETWKNGESNSYELTLSDGSQPIKVIDSSSFQKGGHGTKIKVLVKRNLISVQELTEIISARFLFNPEFKVEINGKQVCLSEHPGIVKTQIINPIGNINIKLTLVDSSAVSRTSNQHGVAFWLGGRLLGSPSWSIQGNQILDGRKSFAKRYTLIAESDDLFDHIEADWSGFKSDFSTLGVIAEAIGLFVKACYLELSKSEIDRAKREIINIHKSDIKELPQLARKELYDFIDQILTENPDIKPELLELAFRAAMNLEKSRAGVALLHKLTTISSSDVEAVDSLLEEWCISDAMSILCEIDSRIKVIEAIERLSSDHSVDELHTLHPLIEKARWVFGPEFDTPEYSSNKGLIKTMDTVFKKKHKKKNFKNSAKRPDIVVGENSSLSALGLEQFDEEIKKTKKVLLIELKKGGFEISREEMTQAKYYVDDIWHAGVGSSRPYIKAYVVGDTIDHFTGKFESVGSDKENQYGEVHALTYIEMVRTAEARLFSLKEKIESRYTGLEQDSLLNELLAAPEQDSLDLAVGE
ncbi:ATP-binding protein [Marinomonas sp. C2222]|uniref:ATP-binding protein n=1 Tax=Marinomonas sargassi TaxID=2984494 RepID=A0ABT2YRA4_9GAMM|nr:ATP-binding protein [Marinomonas sargassi]MCV2402391.1 ATP-binding protein [Marinomonas sargassi]